MRLFLKKHPRWYLYIFTAFLLCVALLFPSTAAAGVSSGITLWLNVVVPALFPFFVLNQLILNLDLLQPWNRLVLKYHGNCGWLPVSANAICPLLLGLLCGLPLGAKITSQSLKKRRISLSDAGFLLAVSNHFSLGFICSYVIAAILEDSAHSFLYLGILYCSGVLSYFIPLCSKKQRIKHEDYARHETLFATGQKSPASKTAKPYAPSKTPTFYEALEESLSVSLITIAKIGGFLLIFSFLSALLQSLSFLPGALTAFLSSLMETTQGIAHLKSRSIPTEHKTALILSAVSFTGLSGLFQTKCVLSEIKDVLPRNFFTTYLLQKIIQAGISYCLTRLLFLLNIL